MKSKQIRECLVCASSLLGHAEVPGQLSEREKFRCELDTQHLMHHCCRNDYRLHQIRAWIPSPDGHADLPGICSIHLSLAHCFASLDMLKDNYKAGYQASCQPVYIEIQSVNHSYPALENIRHRKMH